MGAKRLFVVQIVIVQEEKWFAPETSGPPIRSERQHYIQSTLFAASDVGAAYRMANESLHGYSDANHDGPGDLTSYFALGIHQLEQLTESPVDLPEAVRRPYGVDLGLYDLADVDAQGIPLIRSRDQLDAFQQASLSSRSDRPGA